MILFYQLITRDKKKTQSQVKNIFGSDSSSDEGAPKKKPRTIDISVTQKKLAEKLQAEALAVDSKIFEYDEVYDEIASKRVEEKLAKKTSEARAPKYITKLLVTAEKRKAEHERRVERQVQKDREAEGEQFKDKESFVTSAYRKKLEEMKEAEIAEKREAYLENIGDVTKQQDLSGFYRHIYEQKLDEVKPKEVVEKTDEPAKKKNYRKRKSSADQNEESDKDEKAATESTEKAHLISNLDADSDFSIDSSDSEAEVKKVVEVKQEKPDETVEAIKTTQSIIKTETEKQEVKVEEDETPVEPPKPKIDIWKKRTVGEVLDQALMRYYQRKSEREQAAQNDKK